MNTGQLNITARTFDIGLYDEVDTSIHVNTQKISWTYRDEDSRLIKYTKNINNPTVGEIGDYLVTSAVKEVPEPFSIAGYYPLYLTVHAAAAINSSYHEHTINGKLYYMPNQGGATVNYHGNYSPADTYEELGGFVQISKSETKTKNVWGNYSQTQLT